MSINLYNEVKEIIKVSPLLLLDRIEDLEILEICNSFLPYSIGIEIESPYLIKEEEPKIEGLYLLAKRTIASYEEVTFRIPNGYKGLLALELFSNEIKSYLTKSNSGNHYHIDLGLDFPSLSNYIIREKDYVLKELDTWNYKGNYNKREVGIGKGKWVNLRDDFGTVEIRIGELAIDYFTLFKRITHCCDIVKEVRIKNNLVSNLYYDNNINKEEILTSVDDVQRNYNIYFEKYISKLKLEKKIKETPINQNNKQGIDFVKNKKIICY